MVTVPLFVIVPTVFLTSAVCTKLPEVVEIKAPVLVISCANTSPIG
jgi:hypothetical protein